MLLMNSCHPDINAFVGRWIIDVGPEFQAYLERMNFPPETELSNIVIAIYPGNNQHSDSKYMHTGIACVHATFPYSRFVKLDKEAKHKALRSTVNRAIKLFFWGSNIKPKRF